MTDKECRVSIDELEHDQKQSALDHYLDVGADAIAARVRECMGNAQLQGHADRQLILDMLAEDLVEDAVMNIVSNSSSSIDMPFSEVKYTVGASVDFLTALENRLIEHFSDQ